MKKKIFKYAIALVAAASLFAACSNPVESVDSISDVSVSRTAYTDNVAPSQNPPGGLEPSQVPMLVSIGFDDNAYSGIDGSGGTGGMTWALDLFKDKVNKGSGNPGTFDGTPVRASFYNTTYYVSTWGADSPVFVKRAWNRAYAEGHEIGNHTQAHAEGGTGFSLDRWKSEMQTCQDWLTKDYKYNPVHYAPDDTIGVGVASADIAGFRTPFLAFNDNTFTAMKSMGYQYDCSVNEGFQWGQDGTDNFYPYTLDNGSPGNQDSYDKDTGNTVQLIGSHPGLWEMPLYAVIVPPDEKCAEYGVEPGLRSRIDSRVKWEFGGKITGLDYNMFWLYKMSKKEAVATLKYTLDIRINGNRAPFMFGAHSDYYASKKADSPNATYIERQQALAEFIEYALSKDVVRMVPVNKVLHWMKNPVPLQNGSVEQFDISATADATEGTVTPSGSFKANKHSTVNFEVEPKPGFAIDKILVDNAPINFTGNTFKLENIQGNHDVVVIFKPVPTYTVTTEVVGNGTVTPGSEVVNEGDDLLLTLNYGADVQVAQLLVDGVDQNVDAKATSYTVQGVSKDTLVKVIYEAYLSKVEAVYSISSDWGTGCQVKIIITNKTDAAISSWQLNWEYQGNEQIQVYSANVEQVGKAVTVTNKSWNGTIAPGASLELGAGVTYSGIIGPVPTIVVTAQ